MELKYKGRFVDNWFSNFNGGPVTVDYVTYPSVENYYQSQKTEDLRAREIFQKCSPSTAKKLGRNLNLRKDWDSIKTEIMFKGLLQKFKPGTKQAAALLSTGKAEIVEWNNWGDQYWGKTLDGVGSNVLGSLLMQIRDILNKPVEEIIAEDLIVWDDLEGDLVEAEVDERAWFYKCAGFYFNRDFEGVAEFCIDELQEITNIEEVDYGSKS